MSIILESLDHSATHQISASFTAKRVVLRGVDITHLTDSVLKNDHSYPLFLELRLPGQHTNDSVLPTVQNAGFWTKNNAYTANETDGQFARRTNAFRRLIPIQPSTIDRSTPSGYRAYDIEIAKDVDLQIGDTITTVLHYREPDMYANMAEIQPVTKTARFTVTLGLE